MEVQKQPVHILAVDDEVEIGAFIEELLTSRGYKVQALDDPRRALDVFQPFHPDLCILDFHMPYYSGSVLLDRFKSIDPTTEVIFLTAQGETTLAVDLMKRGAIDFLIKPIDINQLLLSVSRALDHRRLVKENEAYRLHLERLVAEKTAALNDALHSLTHVHSATLDALSTALDFRDQSTSGHSRRVADLTAGVAKRFGVTGSALVQIEHGSLLHDIGKLKIPDSILCKPGPLDDQEWIAMRRHPAYGYEFVRSIEFLKDAAELVLAHHEKFDGSGYPKGICGAAIPFGAKVFAIVDAIDAMIYQRPYNKPIRFHAAAAEVRRCSGSHFDPNLVETTLKFLEEHIPKELL